jgi:hypothetical protein
MIEGISIRQDDIKLVESKRLTLLMYQSFEEGRGQTPSMSLRRYDHRRELLVVTDDSHMG